MKKLLITFVSLVLLVIFLVGCQTVGKAFYIGQDPTIYNLLDNIKSSSYSEGYRFVIPNNSSSYLISRISNLASSLGFDGLPTITESELSQLSANESRYLLHITRSPYLYAPLQSLSGTKILLDESQDKIILYIATSSGNENDLIDAINIVANYQNYALNYDCVEVDGTGVSECVEFDINDLSITVTTLKDSYVVNEQINLIGFNEEIVNNAREQITGYVIRDIDSRDTITYEDQTIEYQTTMKGTNKEKLKYNGFIIKFKDAPVLVKKKELDKIAKQNKEKVDSMNTINPLKYIYPTLNTMPDDVLNEVKSYTEKINLNHIKIKEEIKTKLDSMKSVTKQTVKSNSDELNVLGEYINSFNGLALDISDDEAQEIRKLYGVEEVYPNYLVNITLTESVPLINADNVWDLGYTGRGITIAIIDTGIDYTHPDLGGCFGPGCKVVGGYDFVNNDPIPMDDHGHGTHCGGISAGNGVLKGVAPDAELYAYKVLDYLGRGFSSSVIASIERAVDPNNDGDFSDQVDVISLSLGANCFAYFYGGYQDSCGPDDPTSNAIDNAVNNGVIAVVAAGNSGLGGSLTIESPGTARKAITVGAADKQDLLADFSSRGPIRWTDGRELKKPDIVAPGVNINSLKMGGGYTTMSGTSMAAPHVAGAAALLKQKNPTWTPEEIKQALKYTATTIPSTSEEMYFASEGYNDPHYESREWLQSEIAELCTQITLDNDVVNFFVRTGGGLTYYTNPSIRSDINNNPGNIILEGFWEPWTDYSQFAVGNLDAGTYWACYELHSDLIYNPVFKDVDTFEDKEYHHSDGLWHTMENIDLLPHFWYSISYSDNSNQIGRGRIDVLSAVSLTNIPDVVELNTYHNVEGIIDIKGTASSSSFHSYTLKYGEGINPNRWTELVTFPSAISNDILYPNFDSSLLSDGIYTLNLSIATTNNRIHDIDYITIDNIFLTSPQNLDVLDGKEVIDISGTVKGTNFQNYEIKIGYGDEWFTHGITLINNGNNEIISGVLGNIDLSEVVNTLGAGFYQLKLIVYNTDGHISEHEIVIGIESYLDGWPKYVGGNPSIADIDNDGDLDVVTGKYAWNHDGTLLVEWPQSGTTPALADIDNDGDLEIFIRNFTGIYAYHHDGSTVDGWPYQGDSGFKPVSIVDVNNDGDLEIITVSESSKKVYVLNHDGTLFDGNNDGTPDWPYTLQEDFIRGITTVADLNGDNNIEIIISGANWDDNSDDVYVFNIVGELFDGNNDGTPDWPQNGGHGNTVVVGDINNDGNLEIIALSRFVVHVFNTDGTELSGFPLRLPGKIQFNDPPVLADINEDGYLEIIGIANAEYGGHDIIIVKYDGTYVWEKGFREILDEYGNKFIGSVPIVADIDGDEDMELIVNVKFDTLYPGASCIIGEIFAYHHNGDFVSGFPKILPDCTSGTISTSQLSINDLDQDGDIELIGTAGNSIFVIDLSSSYNQNKVEWGMFAHDIRHTNLYTSLDMIEIQCSDTIDNDGDGLIDINDPGCSSPADNDESDATSECQDNIDNDADGAIDYSEDFSCSSLQDNDESIPLSQCQDSIDNDGDELVDLNDAGCSNNQDNDESDEPECSEDIDCDNGLYCDGEEACNLGVCETINIPVIDDGISCTVDSCDDVNDIIINNPDDSLCPSDTICADYYCDQTLDCQANYEPDTTECKALEGLCDVPEYCTGLSSDCPIDQIKPNTYECRPSEGLCDTVEYCTGSSPDCPTDEKLTTVCRDAVSDCDLTENCDGVNDDCPTDYQTPVGTECGEARNCLADSCNSFFAEFYPADGHDTCDGVGHCDVYSCAITDSYCSDDDSLDGVNTLECGAGCDQNEDCAVGYECNLIACQCVESQCFEKEDGTYCDNGIYCDGQDRCQNNACVNIGPMIVCDDGVGCTDDICNEVTNTCDYNPNNVNCDDNLFCNGQEICSIIDDCQTGTSIDCSENDVTEIATCHNNPDSNSLTWDYRESFISGCDENHNQCTIEDRIMIHTCDITNCNAQCESDDDCNQNYICDLTSCNCIINGEYYCGDDIKNLAVEECDGIDLDQQTCQSLGYEGGILSCNNICEFDTNNCYDIQINASIINNKGGSNVEGILIMELQRKFNETWEDYLEVVNQQVIVPAYSYLSLGSVWNPNNVVAGEIGNYMVYARFEVGSQEITATYEFTIKEEIITCSDECSSLGQTRCNGDFSENCGNYDNDTCIEWGDSSYCNYGCASGSCKMSNVTIEDTIGSIKSSPQSYKQVIGSTAVEDNIAAIDIAGFTGIQNTLDDTEQVTIDENMVVIGGSCVNRAAAALLGLTYPSCGVESTIPQDKGIIKVFNNGGNTQILVAGWEAIDTRIAAQAVVRFLEFNQGLNTNQVMTNGTSLEDVNIQE